MQQYMSSTEHRSLHWIPAGAPVSLQRWDLPGRVSGATLLGFSAETLIRFPTLVLGIALRGIGVGDSRLDTLLSTLPGRASG